MRNVGVGGPGSFQDGRGHGRFRVTEELHKNACNVLSFQRGEEETTAVRAAETPRGVGEGAGDTWMQAARGKLAAGWTQLGDRVTRGYEREAWRVGRGGPAPLLEACGMAHAGPRA